MKWIWLGVLAAWGGIVWLAWEQANRRIGPLCHFDRNYCKPALLAARDNTLIWGASIPLALLVLMLLLGRVPVPRLNRRKRPSTSRELIDHERNDGA